MRGLGEEARNEEVIRCCFLQSTTYGYGAGWESAQREKRPEREEIRWGGVIVRSGVMCVHCFFARAAAVAAVGVCTERAGAHRRRGGRSGLREKRFAWGVIVRSGVVCVHCFFAWAAAVAIGFCVVCGWC